MRLLLALILGSVLAPAPAAAAGAPAEPARHPAGQAAPAGTDPCPGGWRPVGVPGLRHRTLADVTRTEAGGWIVGTRSLSGQPRLPIAARLVGGRWGWTRPVPGEDAGFTAVAARAGVTWAVGYDAYGRTLTPVAQRWTGRRWISADPPLAGSSATLTDVAIDATGRAVAVGYAMGDAGPFPLVYRHDARWERLDLRPAGFGALTSVVAGAAGTWVAGWLAGNGAIRAYIARRTGGGWVRETVPLPPGETVATALAEGPDGTPWVAGYRRAGAATLPVLARRDPGGWTIEPLPLAGDAADVFPHALAVPRGGRPILGAAARPRAGALLPAIVRPATPVADLRYRPGGTRPSGRISGLAARGRSLIAVGWDSGGDGVVLRPCSAGSAGGPGGSDGAGPWPARGRIRIETDDTHAATGPLPGGAAALPPADVDDIAADAGLPRTLRSYGGLAFDADEDGRDDLLLPTHPGTAALLRGTPDGFVPRAARGLRTGANELIVRVGTETRDDRAAQLGVDDPYGRGRAALVLDADADGAPDLLVTNEPLRVDGLPSVNRLFLGNGADPLALTPAPELGLDLPIGGACVATAELDGSGRPEVLLCTDEPWAGLPAGLHVLGFRDGRYRDVTAALRIPEPGGVRDAIATDLDGDGRADLALLSAGRLRILLAEDGRFRRVAVHPVPGGGVALGSGDIDGDGDTDLLVVAGIRENTPDLLLRNAGTGRGWSASSVSQDGRGSADAVVPIRRGAGGRTAFVILNGRDRTGPVQLIVAR
ncbi:MAG: FG-GAP repeat domain-containing protein [Chloroflexota bacterium]